MTATGTRGGSPLRVQDMPASVSPAPAAAGAGANSFEQAKAASEMRAARSEAMADASLAERGLRRAGSRVFAWQDSAWVDQRPVADGARRVAVQPFSAAYFALMDRIEDLRSAFALGDRVEVHGRRVTVVLEATGATTLDAASLNRLVAEF